VSMAFNRLNASVMLSGACAVRDRTTGVEASLLFSALLSREQARIPDSTSSISHQGIP
jgi:hypothetical protein